MEGFTRAARRAAMFAVAFGSAGFGVLMIWALVRPGVIAGVATVEMIVVLGLFLLPAATLAAWFVDHRAIAEEPAGAEEATSVAGPIGGALPFETVPPSVTSGRHTHNDEHAARHGAGARRHRRPVAERV